MSKGEQGGASPVSAAGRSLSTQVAHAYTHEQDSEGAGDAGSSLDAAEPSGDDSDQGGEVRYCQ